MDIALCINHSEKNKINKSLSDMQTYSGTLKNETSVVNPVILMQVSNPTSFNYAYIPEFRRYYFITDMTSVTNDTWRLSMTVDVLESFKNEILAAPAIVSDSEVTGADKYIAGPVWKTKVKTLTDIVNFPSGLSESGEFILITAGG